MRPLPAERLREVIVGPLSVKGFSFESEAVIEALVADALRTEGSLPLLQFALTALWDVRDPARRILPAGALDAIGGVDVKVDLPPAVDVPEGFVYVPRGRFLYGGAGDEERRRSFFHAAPLHPIETEAYLVARDETTYEDWIAFLKASSPDERRRRSPSAKGQGYVVALAELPDGDYELTLGPEDHPHVARSAEPIRYRGRSTRAEQRWGRFPVTGVSYEDVLAYTAWLDQSGRVPGVREHR